MVKFYRREVHTSKNPRHHPLGKVLKIPVYISELMKVLVEISKRVKHIPDLVQNYKYKMNNISKGELAGLKVIKIIITYRRKVSAWDSLE